MAEGLSGAAPRSTSAPSCEAVGAEHGKKKKVVLRYCSTCIVVLGHIEQHEDTDMAAYRCSTSLPFVGVPPSA